MNNDAKVRPWSGRLLWRVLFVGALVPSITGAQSSPTNAVAKKASVRRANELVLAGLRPGNDKIAKARALYGSSNDKASKFFAADAKNGDGRVIAATALRQYYATILNASVLFI